MAKILTRSHGDAETGRARAPREPITTSGHHAVETGRARAPREPWPRVKLGDVCEVTAGSPAPQEKKLFEKGTHPFIRTSDVGVVHVGHINSSRDKLNEEGIQKLRLFPKGSVLFPKSGASTFLNHRVLLDVDAYVVSHLAVIIPSEKVAPEYLLCHLATVDARDLMQDVNYPALRTTEISNIEIPLPPLSVQCEIVARLERELGAVEKVTKAFEELERAAEGEFKAELKETFEEISRGGAETRRLGEVCEKIVDGSHNPPKGVVYSDYPMLSSKNVQDFTITFDRPRYLTQCDFYDENKRTMVHAGDVLFTIVGTVGRVAKVPSTVKSFCLQRSVAVLKLFKQFVDADYLVYQLISQRDVLEVKAQGAAQKGLYLSQLAEVALPIPLPHVQRSIVAHLDAARLRKERLLAAAKKGKAVAALWRKAILKEAFA